MQENYQTRIIEVDFPNPINWMISILGVSGGIFLFFQILMENPIGKL